MLEIKDDTVIKIKGNIFLQKIDELEKYWVFDIDSGDYYTLNETSYWVLEQIQEPRSTEEVLKLFTSNYGIDEQKARKDFIEIINQFYLNNLIEGGGGNG